MIQFETDSNGIPYQTKIKNNNEQCQRKGAIFISIKLESTTAAFKIVHIIQFVMLYMLLGYDLSICFSLKQSFVNIFRKSLQR